MNTSKKYQLSGMTCNGCKATIENSLKNIDGVVSVDADRERGEVKILMDRLIQIDEFQKSLSEKYSIREFSAVKSNNDDTEKKSKLQQLKPLLIIIFYLTVAANLNHFNDWSLKEAMLDFMGLFYIVFSFFKMLDLRGFPDSFRMYDPLAKQIPIYGWLYPFIETALGIMFLMRIELSIALWITLIILGITTIGVFKVLFDKKSIRCACLGTVLKLPMTEATIIENLIMIAMAISMLIGL